ncbi:MAG: type II secretion system protein N [Delftia tsuruhatensis]
MVTLSLNRGQARTWHVKAATFVLWLLAAGIVAFWAMRPGNGGAGAPVPPAPPEALQVDAPALAQALGGVAAAQGVAVPVAAPVVSRYALVGVLAGRDSGGGAAVIAVGNQPAKPFRVGRAVEEGVVLQSVSGREARLGPSVDGPASITLQLSLPDKR